MVGATKNIGKWKKLKYIDENNHLEIQIYLMVQGKDLIMGVFKYLDGSEKDSYLFIYLFIYLYKIQDLVSISFFNWIK